LALALTKFLASSSKLVSQNFQYAFAQGNVLFDNILLLNLKNFLVSSILIGIVKDEVLQSFILFIGYIL
jgi:hypothetical protein